ncbi:MAG TPA: response regulator [Nitrososphaeraceae archaeon]|nr:response regulator [Nitrososphaeraceae archaeon]
MIPPQDTRENVQHSAQKTILVCDDETDLLLMFRIYLESQYKVITVDSGESCIDTILDHKNKNEEIDLLLLDYKLGDISGDIVARKAKEIDDLKILMITAFELDNQIVNELIQQGLIVDVVKKPVQLEQLSQKIKETMAGQ